ncbi:MAG: hypothetical protein AAFR31_03555 [Cyanobacteria bacterium J06627_8]
MWSTSTYWFDVSLIFGIFAIGNILFGHFEEHRPKWRRLSKVGTILSVGLLLSYFNLRWLFYVILFALAIAVSYIHLVWLPKHGINGWTGEPKDEYLTLVSGKQRQS